MVENNIMNMEGRKSYDECLSLSWLGCFIVMSVFFMGHPGKLRVENFAFLKVNLVSQVTPLYGTFPSKLINFPT